MAGERIHPDLACHLPGGWAPPASRLLAGCDVDTQPAALRRMLGWYRAPAHQLVGGCSIQPRRSIVGMTGETRALLAGGVIVATDEITGLLSGCTIFVRVDGPAGSMLMEVTRSAALIYIETCHENGAIPVVSRDTVEGNLVAELSYIVEHGLESARTATKGNPYGNEPYGG